MIPPAFLATYSLLAASSGSSGFGGRSCSPLFATPASALTPSSSSTSQTTPPSPPSSRALSVESFKVMDVLKRANELQAQGHEVLHCEVGQPETGAPDTVAAAAVEALTSPPQVLGYTDAFGLLPLRERISEHYEQYYDWEDSSTTTKGSATIPTDRIVVTTGSSGAFLLAFTGCFDVGDTVAIASSGYPCYRNILSSLGCQMASIGINSEYKLTANELKAEIQRRREREEPPIKGLILSSPSNPTGAMLTPEELKDLCELCDQEGIQFISDEIYHGITYGNKEATALQYSDNAIVINSFSKYYSMSGWRLGWMIIPEHLVDVMNSLQQNYYINAPTISQTAAMKCWDNDTIQQLEQHIEKYRTSRQIILDQLDTIEPKLDIAPVDGGFYVYVDLGEYSGSSVQMCEQLLEEQFVAFTPGTDFEDPATDLGDRRFRISYAGGIDTVREAMDRFTKNFWPTWREQIAKEEYNE